MLPHVSQHDVYGGVFLCCLMYHKLTYPALSIWPPQHPATQNCVAEHPATEHTGNTQGTHREHTGNTQGTHREHTGNTQGTHTEHTGNSCVLG